MNKIPERGLICIAAVHRLGKVWVWGHKAPGQMGQMCWDDEKEHAGLVFFFRSTVFKANIWRDN